MREVPISLARTHWSALVRAAEETGEVIAITRNGRVMAHLNPLSAADLQRVEQVRAARTEGNSDA